MSTEAHQRFKLAPPSFGWEKGPSSALVRMTGQGSLNLPVDKRYGSIGTGGASRLGLPAHTMQVNEYGMFYQCVTSEA
jgi:hypothetical protein